MDFGRTDPSELNHIDFTLPPEPHQNSSILGGSEALSPKIHIGCARWGTKEWMGQFYPEHTKEKDFLHYYAKLFNTVEVSTTYYRVPSPEQVVYWKSQVTKDFRFCPKFPQFITHEMKLQNCDKEVNEFVRSVSYFEETLGPVFLMPHPQMGIKELPVIERFIERLPQHLHVFLELRHPSWFANGLHPKLLSFVTDYNIGLVITDVAGRRDCAHMYLSIKETFIRFVGNGLHPTDYTRVQEWAKRMQLWMNEGMEKIYFFMHQPQEINSPFLNKYLIEQLNSIPGIHLEPPQVIRPQATLFD